MKLADADRRKLPALLDELARAVEELLLSGLTTASEATRQTLNISFQEASRMRLLRLGSTLRVANEELGRFTRNEPEFSHKRLCFFLNRAWLLSHGLSRALRDGDEQEFERLLWVPASEPVERLEVVTLGVAKKVAVNAFVAFEFRLRTVAASGPIPAGQRLVWSCVFPLKPGMNIPAEAFLILPQKQQFAPSLFLERKVLVIEKAAVALDEFGGGRISLGEASKVSAGEPFTDWQRFQTWDPAAALRRIQEHEAGPFDLDVEMQEEVVLEGWQLGEPGEGQDGQTVYPITYGGTVFDGVVSAGAEGKALGKALGALRKTQAPPLFGLLHYARCRLVLQPLAVFGKDGAVQLMLSDEKIDRAALLKTLKF
ncbi:MAG TPA: hypothetical protein VEL76_26795 [Gemmataceae bacterium]|nr:hypothetical protein [Gemmataceae bacterium]